MRAIILPHAIRHEIVDYLRSLLPYEGCGLLVGRGQIIERVINIKNVATDARHRYKMAGEALAPALLDIENKDEEWLGVFHSHIGSMPIPSQTDIDEATMQTVGMAHLIVSFVDDVVHLGAWCIESDGQVQRVTILSHRNELDMLDKPLSNHERGWLLSVGFMAVIILLVTAVMLLPAAPSLN